MRTPLRANVQRADRLRGVSIRGPVGGWNARDSLADMKPDDAVILDNWFPETANLELRKGSANHVTGISGQVDTLMEFASGSARKLFGIAGGSIYNVSVAGAVGAADVSGLTNSRWQHTMFGTSGGQFLVAVNGADAPRNYDGTTWATTPAITGVTGGAATLVHVNAFKQRLFFAQNDTLKFWFLAVSSIGGAASGFDLAPFCRFGGKLMAMGTWTRDGGDGVDDLAVFITSTGEVLVYQGTDPAVAANWALVGVFHIGAPIGRRCLMKVGADLIVITQDGFLPLSRVLAEGRANQSSALSDKIRTEVEKAARAYSANFGWQPIFYPKGTMALFNVPTKEAATSQQFVVHTTTGAWCRFTGMNANCWSLFSDDLYFGTNGKVMKADTGTSDAGANIDADVLTSFSYMGQPGRLKRYTMVRPLLLSNGTVQAALEASVDYEIRNPTASSVALGSGGSAWDTSPWDTSPWALDDVPIKGWQAVTGLGFAAALRMKVATNALSIKWQSTEWLYELGGRL